MLVKIISENAENRLIEFLEQNAEKPKNIFFLDFKASLLGFRVDTTEFITLVKDILQPLNASVFFMRDGDITISWSGKPNETLAQLKSKISDAYKDALSNFNPSKVFYYSDFHIDAENLRLQCMQKIKDAEVEDIDAAEVLFVERACTSINAHLYEILQKKIASRQLRSKKHVLIVEDQDFSVKLLSSILSNDYVQSAAHDAAKAILTFCLNAPDIVMLDIGLPDRSGHSLAKLFKRLDPDVHIIMVSGNKSYRDISLARRNAVDGYIVKPYQKAKILDALKKIALGEKAV
jgi:two-component system chemotaxis response regulator CheY